MANVNFHSFESSSALAEGLARHVVTICENADKRPSLAFSGGNTPKAFLLALGPQLATLSAGAALALVDERWVPPSNPRSNEAMIKQHVNWPALNNNNALTMLSLWQEDKTPLQAATQAERHMVQNFKQPFDAIILGMGLDGHTASWFPQSAELAQATNTDHTALYMPVQTEPEGETRLTLTLACVLQAKNIIIHFEGHEKHEVFEKALQADDFNALPIRHILHHPLIDVQVYWAP